jgi:hypothetical protein
MISNKFVKKIVLSSATTALLFSVIAPFSAFADNTSVSSSTYNEIAVPSSNTPAIPNGVNISPEGEVTPQGKVGWTIKAIKAALRASASKIDGVIKATIDYLPVSQSIKNTLVNTVRVELIIKALDVVTDFSGNIEDALSQALQYLGVAGWIADIFARAISAIFL